MGQELPLQNRFLYTSGFSGETRRPRFFHIFPLQNGSLYFWWFSFFQVAILLKCVLMSGSPLCRGSVSENHKSAPKKRGWAPGFCRETPLLDLWQVPPTKWGHPTPPGHFFLKNQILVKITGQDLRVEASGAVSKDLQVMLASSLQSNVTECITNMPLGSLLGSLLDMTWYKR